MHSAGIVVSPYDSHTVALERDCTSGIGGGVTIYDDSVPRPHAVYIDGSSPRIFAFGGLPSVMYGFGGGSFFTLTLDASGATASTPLSNAGSADTEMLYLNGRLYSTSGAVYDPVARAQVPRLPGYPSGVSSIAANADGHTLYTFSSDRRSVAAFDLVHGTFIGEVAIPGPSAIGQQLVRWGTDGVAFISNEGSTVLQRLNGGNVYLVRTDLVQQ